MHPTHGIETTTECALDVLKAYLIAKARHADLKALLNEAFTLQTTIKISNNETEQHVAA